MKHLFVVAHPDDEVLGAGAFIYDSVQKGDEVAVLIFNTCDMTRYEEDRTKILKDMMESHRILGITTRFLDNIPDGNFQNADHRKMVEFIEKAIRQFSPDCIYTHHISDNNHDHIVVSQCCMEAVRLWQRSGTDDNRIKGFYMMEVPSSTDWSVNPICQFTPNTFVPVSADGFLCKVDALECYENVIRPLVHPRSIECLRSLAKIRGSQCGSIWAEAFQCVFRQGV